MFYRDNKALPIIRKIKKYVDDHKMCYLKDIVSEYMPFGLRSFERGSSQKGELKLHHSKGHGYISRSEVTVGAEYIDTYNVMFGKAISGHLGEYDSKGQVKVLATLKQIGPKEITTESYLVAGKFETKQEAANLEKYFKTKFLRFLLLQSLASMNITNDRFDLVPLEDFKENSLIDWSKEIRVIDIALCQKYDVDFTYIDKCISDF